MQAVLRTILGLPLWARFAALAALLATAAGLGVWQAATAGDAARARADAFAAPEARARVAEAAARALRGLQVEAAAPPAQRDDARKTSGAAAAALREALHAANANPLFAGPSRTAANAAAVALDNLPALRSAGDDEALAVGLRAAEAALLKAALEPQWSNDEALSPALAQSREESRAAGIGAARLGIAAGSVGILGLVFAAIYGWGTSVQAAEALRVARGLAAGRRERPAAALAEDELGTLAELLNAAAEHDGGRAALAAELAPSAHEVAAAAQAVRSYADEQSAAAAEQESAVADSAAALGLMARAATAVVDQSQAFGAQARRALEIAGGGRQAVRDALADLECVVGQVDAAARAILALSEQAAQIGEIVATVNDVAEQTNLMALNAALEASRAGEHGKGFAVVAEEVKTLAGQSKKATEQVRTLLNDIQNATNTAALASEQGAKAAAQAGKVALRAGEAIDGLDAALAEAAVAGDGIGGAAAEQAAGMGTISDTMARLEEAARNRTAALDDLARSVGALDAVGGRLAEFAAPPHPPGGAGDEALLRAPAGNSRRMAKLRSMSQR